MIFFGNVYLLGINELIVVPNVFLLMLCSCERGVCNIIKKIS